MYVYNICASIVSAIDRVWTLFLLRNKVILRKGYKALLINGKYNNAYICIYIYIYIYIYVYCQTSLRRTPMGQPSLSLHGDVLKSEVNLVTLGPKNLPFSSCTLIRKSVAWAVFIHWSLICTHG